MKKEYKGHRISFHAGYYWWCGEAFRTLQDAKDGIDAYINSEPEENVYEDENEAFDFWRDNQD